MPAKKMTDKEKTKKAAAKKKGNTTAKSVPGSGLARKGANAIEAAAKRRKALLDSL